MKRRLDRAGDGRAWHHIVEQTPSNIARFGEKMIHNLDNVVNIPHGKGSLHSLISSHYSSIKEGTTITVRKWLSTKSFEEQYEYGLNLLFKYVKKNGMDIFLN